MTSGWFMGRKENIGWMCFWWVFLLVRMLCRDVRAMSKWQITENHVIFMVSYIFIVTLSGWSRSSVAQLFSFCAYKLIAITK